MRGRSRHVRSPDGREWIVGIRWLPRRPKWFGWGFGWRRRRPDRDRSARWDFLDLSGPEEGAFIIVAVLTAVIVAWFFIFPVLVFLLDLLLLALIAVTAIGVRVLFRRPWIVQAVSSEEELTWPVVGWRKSLERVDHVAVRLQRGLALEDLPAPR